MIVQFSSHALVIIWKRYYFLTKEFVYIVTKEKNEKKIKRYLSDIKDNGVAKNELENARDNGTLADYLKKQDVAFSDENLEGQCGGMGNDGFTDARCREL